MITRTDSAQDKRNERDRGAVLVEAAIAIPLLLLVILGALEFGIGWQAKSATTNGLRSGLLRAASLADDPNTDLRVLQSIIGEVGADNAENLLYVTIFNADSINGDVDTIVDNCGLAGGLPEVLGAAGFPADGGSGGFPHCVTYGPGAIQELAATANADDFLAANFDFGPAATNTATAYTCAAGLLDSAGFCAPGRAVNGDIQIGVAFEYQHDWLTGILPFAPPTFREVQTSSTFVADGSNIGGSGATTLTVTPGTNLALGGTASASSVRAGGVPQRAIDGNTNGHYQNGNTSTHTNEETEPFLDIDLGASFTIDQINVWNRTNCCTDRLDGFVLLVSDTPFTEAPLDGKSLAELRADPNIFSVMGPTDAPEKSEVDLNNAQGRYVRIMLPGDNRILTVAEIEILAA